MKSMPLSGFLSIFENFEKINPYFIQSFNNEHALLESIKKVHFNFTENRSALIDYTKSSDLVSAYSFYYLPSNYLKLDYLMSKISRERLNQLFEAEDSFEIVDYGSGPGTYLWAFTDWALENKINLTSLHQIDQSALMHLQCSKFYQYYQNHFSDKKIATTFFQYKSTSEFLKRSAQRITPNILTTHKKNKKILIIGNSLNEVSAQEMNNILEIKPDIILIIEPGTKQSFQQFLLMRGKLVSSDYQILYPCLSQMACPLNNSEKDWCHQYLNTHLENNIGQYYSQVCQKLKMKRQAMPVVMGVFSLNNVNLKIDNDLLIEGFIVRRYPSHKAFYCWDICFKFQEQNYVKKMTKLKRHLSTEEHQQIDEITSGDYVLFEWDVNPLADKNSNFIKSIKIK